MTLFTLFFTKVTRKTLNDRFSKGQTEALIEDMWQQYNELSPDLLDGISPTGKFLMKTSGGALALFHTLVNHGTEEGEARQIIADVNWSFIGGGSPLRKGMIRLQYELTRIVGRDPVKRLDWCLAPLWRFIFTMPPWEKRNLPSDDGVLALDVIRCPWADYFRSVGQPELGATAFCDIDFKLAEIWGFDLKRNGLLMTGAPCCDFRFTPKNK
jgi:ubiquinone biosynthesis protein